MTLRTFFFFSIALIGGNINAQIYKDSSQPVEQRVQDLLGRMTLEEKFWQVFMIPSDGDTTDGKFRHGIFGLQVSAGVQGDAAGQLLSYNTSQNAAEVAQKINQLQAYFVNQTRLGIPIIPFDEALHGLVRQGATTYPQAIGLAATWDTTLIRQIASNIAATCKARGIRQILSPVINLATDVRWGRTEETYGEDPFLTSAIGSSFIGTFEKNGVITTPKHFVANVGAGGRDSYPVFWSDWYLEQSHFVPFKTVVQNSGARSVMTAYNSLNGIACSSNSWLLTQKLKNEWGFKGFVISDANAVGGEVVLHGTAADYAASGAHAINAGLDVIFQTDYQHASLFYPAFVDGSIDPARLDDAVARVLRAKFELGLFENPYVPVPENGGSLAETGRAIAQEAAEESFVLLKNDRHTLPFTSSGIKIALFGNDAAHPRLGGYSGPGNNPISILDGLKAIYPQVQYLEAISYADTDYVNVSTDFLTNETGEIGLNASIFSNPELQGEPVERKMASGINESWTLYGPNTATGNAFYSVRWSGNITVPDSRSCEIGLEGNDGYRFYLDDQLVIDRWEKISFHRDLVPVHFSKGQSHRIRVEFKEPEGNGRIRLIWNYGVRDSWKKDLEKAVHMADKADIAIVVAGIQEGEFQDRASLRLPGNQEELIRRLHQTGKPVVVLLVGGSAITMNDWIDDADAIVSIWYPGESGGNAVANLLSGKINPSGKLPVTFPLSEAQLPLTYNHLPTGRGDDYNNLTGEPLFPFGFGLSYTEFSYANAQLQHDTLDKNTGTQLSFTLTNTGKVAGDEVVQLYLKTPLSSIAQPVISLKGFQRVHLNAGESTIVHFGLTPGLFAHLSSELRETIESGNYELFIGSSSRDLRLKSIVHIR